MQEMLEVRGRVRRLLACFVHQILAGITGWILELLIGGQMLEGLVGLNMRFGSPVCILVIKFIDPQNIPDREFTSLFQTWATS